MTTTTYAQYTKLIRKAKREHKRLVEEHRQLVFDRAATAESREIARAAVRPAYERIFALRDECQAAHGRNPLDWS